MSEKEFRELDKALRRVFTEAFTWRRCVIAMWVLVGLSIIEGILFLCGVRLP